MKGVETEFVNDILYPEKLDNVKHTPFDKINLMKGVETEFVNDIKSYPYDKTDIQVKTIPLVAGINESEKLEVIPDQKEKLIKEPSVILDHGYEHEIPKYTSIYTGIFNDETIYGCNVVASHFKDKFIPNSRNFERIKYFTWDYLGKIHEMNKDGYTCIWLGDTWALGVFRDTFETYRYFEKSTEELNKETSSKDVELEKIVESYDEDGSIVKSIIVEIDNTIKVRTVQTPVGVMVFCKCTSDEAAEYYSKISRNISLYDWDKYYAVNNFPLNITKDIIHLYPMSYFIVDTYTVFFSSALYEYQLPPIVNYMEMRYQISKINELDAKYASSLCMERLNYNHTITYDKQMLRISDTGYIQAEEIKQVFLECLTYISKNGIRYTKVSTPIDISFTCNGYWYTVLNPLDIPEIKDGKGLRKINPTDSKLLHFGLRQKVPDEKFHKSDLPPLMINVNEVKDELYMTYMYCNTQIISKKIEDNNDVNENVDFSKKIYRNYLKGLYFCQAVKNVLRNYPKYILSREAIYL